MIEFDLLMMAVKEITNVEKEDIISKRRFRDLVELRMICAIVLKEHNKRMPIEKIGGLFNVDHSTITHYMKTHRNFMFNRNISGHRNYMLIYTRISKQFKYDIMFSGGKPKEALLEKKKKLEEMLEEVNMSIMRLDIELKYKNSLLC